MTTPSKVVSSRTRKTKPVSRQKAIQLTPEMICTHSRAQGWKEITLSRAEMKIVGHVLPLTFATPQDVVKEIRRLLGESAAKCKVIPFPVGGKRGIQLAKEA